MATVINDTNIKSLITDYFRNKNSLPQDLRNKTLNEWVVSNVTNMSGLFRGKRTFNEELNEWDVSNVTDMSNMFNSCEKFNKPLNNWNVSNVTNMEQMFYFCKKFNQPLFNLELGNKVTIMNNMFDNCTNFNQPLNNWIVSNVIEMEFMFNRCNNFNQPLNNWNVSNVTNMDSMFRMCTNFNKPLNNWNVSNVTNMDGMFTHCTYFNKPLNDWTMNPQVSTEDMFLECGIEENNKPPLTQAIVYNPNEVHEYASRINYPKLNIFLKEKLNNINVPANLNFASYVNQTITEMIENSAESPEKKTEQRASLQSIMNLRLNRLNYQEVSQDVRNSIYYILEYVKLQSPEFKNLYVYNWIEACVTEAYGGKDLTCAGGVLDRLCFALSTTCVFLLSSGENPDYEMIKGIIARDPIILVPEYIKDWYRLHKTGTENEFSAETTEEQKKESLKNYLLDLLPDEETLIDEKIIEFADNIGYEADDFQYGGRRRKTMKRRKSNKRKTMKRRKPNKRKTMRCRK